MYVRRKVFSVLTNDMGEEKLFSVNETIFEGYEVEEEREFSEKEEDSKKVRRKVSLKDVNSHRGLGRSYILGGYGGAIGGYVSKGKANKLDEMGATDLEIKEGAIKRGRNVGAAAGAGMAALSSIPYLKAEGVDKKTKAALALLAAGAGAGAGALGGHFGAKKNVRTRLEKRKDLEDKIKD